MINETVLEFSIELEATSKEVYDFHLNFNNVSIVTPSFINVRFLLIPQQMKEGSEIKVELKQFGYWFPWDITVEKIVPTSLMVDYQSGKGPFKTWRHEHIFLDHKEKTILIDRISYHLPFGILGYIADVLFMRFIQKKVFAFRHKKTKEYFSKK